MNSHSDTVAVLGDIGGHSSVLWTMLQSLGFAGDVDSSTRGAAWSTADLEIPEGIQIVQVGDLIHRGPDSVGVVTLVNRLLAEGIWTQLVGNHEQLYVDQAVFDWPESLDPGTAKTLRQWWATDQMVPAAAITTAGENWLVTHAGLTRDYWSRALGSPLDVQDTLGALEEARRDGILFHPGAMLTGVASFAAGPVWAAASSEVYPGWHYSETAMPFSQAHGHSSAFHWNHSRWNLERAVRKVCAADPLRRHVTFTNHEHRIVGVDPNSLADPAEHFAPLVIEHAAVVTAAP